MNKPVYPLFLLTLVSCDTQSPKKVIHTPLRYETSLYAMQGDRAYMEDRYTICTTENYMIAAVLNGHGGSEIADWLKENFPPRLVEALSKLGAEADSTMLKDATIKCYQELDKEIFDRLRQQNKKSSSTAVVYLTIKCPKKGKREMLIIFGDSRAIIVRDGKVDKETVDHKPKDTIEKDRIETNEGAVHDDRVWLYGYKNLPGGLGVARAFSTGKKSPQYIRA